MDFWRDVLRLAGAVGFEELRAVAEDELGNGLRAETSPLLPLTGRWEHVRCMNRSIYKKNILNVRDGA